MIKEMDMNKMRYTILIILIFLSLACANRIKSDKLLHIQGPFLENDYKEMRREAGKVVDFIKENKIISNKSSDTSTLSFLEPQNDNHTDNLICRSCLYTFTKFHNLLEKKYGLTLFNEFLSLMCTVAIDHKICGKLVSLYSSIIIDSIVEHYLDAEYICSKTHICKSSHFLELDPDDYARELLKDKPARESLVVDFQAETLKVLHLTDFHTDLMYKEGSKGLCAEPLCCREGQGESFTMNTAGRWGFQGKCDIPLRTLDLFIKTVTEKIKPDVIVWTGDNAPHNPWLDNKEEIYEVTKVFVDLLYNKYNFQGAVYPSLGNHEEFIADQYNPFSGENEFLKRMGDMFKQWLKKDEYEHFLEHGYYSSLFRKNLRIVAINCFLCDVLNFYLIRNPTDPDNQFKWLEMTLREAEANNEKVMIIGHIPPGDSTYLSQCSKRYNALVDRFSNIIRGQFYGHTHYDEFRIITEYFNPSNVAGLILTSPSLTSYSFKNPSFRVYEVDSSTFLVKDYLQYRLNITEANATPDVTPQFKVAYSAKKMFGFEHLNDYAPFRESIERISKDDQWFGFITDSFYAQGVEKLSYESNKRLKNYLTCRFKESVFDDYMKCTGYRTWDYAEYINKFIEFFTGKWYVKTYEEGYYKADHTKSIRNITNISK